MPRSGTSQKKLRPIASTSTEGCVSGILSLTMSERTSMSMIVGRRPGGPSLGAVARDAWAVAFTLAFTESLWSTVLGRYLPLRVVLATFAAELALAFGAIATFVFLLGSAPVLRVLVREKSHRQATMMLLPAFAAGASWISSLWKIQKLPAVLGLWLVGNLLAAWLFVFLFRGRRAIPDRPRHGFLWRCQLSTLCAFGLLVWIHSQMGSAGEQRHKLWLVAGFGGVSALLVWVLWRIGRRGPRVHTEGPWRIDAGWNTSQLLVLCAACLLCFEPRGEQSWTKPPSVGPGTEGSAPRPNLVLISIDTLNADHLHCHGYARDTSPAIDTLSEQGVLFEQAISTAPWTLPSHSALFTSRYPGDLSSFTIQGRPQLASILKTAGYRTIAFTGGRFVDRRRFGAGFDNFCDDYEEAYIYGFSPILLQTAMLARRGLRFLDRGAAVLNPINHWRHDQPGRTSCFAGPERSSRAAAAFIRSYREQRPFYLFFHTFVVHEYYLSTDEMRREADRWCSGYRGWLRSGNLRYGSQIPEKKEDLEFLVGLYDGTIRIADRAVREILEALVAGDLDTNTLVVVTSDHGESFRPDLNRTWHRMRLHDDLLHVPLILRFPGKLQRSTRLVEQVSSVDVLPTILDLLNLPPIEDARGRSLVPALDPRAGEAPRRFAFSEHAEYTEAGQGRSVRTKDHKWIESRSRGDELYDLLSDPEETKNLALEPTPALEELRRQVSAFGSSLSGGVNLSKEDEEMLEAIGYMDTIEEAQREAGKRAPAKD